MNYVLTKTLVKKSNLNSTLLKKQTIYLGCKR